MSKTPILNTENTKVTTHILFGLDPLMDPFGMIGS